RDVLGTASLYPAGWAVGRADFHVGPGACWRAGGVVRVVSVCFRSHGDRSRLPGYYRRGNGCVHGAVSVRVVALRPTAGPAAAGVVRVGVGGLAGIEVFGGSVAAGGRGSAVGG